MLRCGLLGIKLPYSYSPQIHARFPEKYSYELFEKQPEEVEDFVKNGAWDGINVTIPYKREVLKYVDEQSEIVKKIGSANTLVRRKDGTIFADNTDVYGFRAMVLQSGINVSGVKALILGSGGASVSVREVLQELGAETVIISRSGENNYDNIEQHADAEVVVNTTPVGTYPNNGQSPLDLRRLPNLKGVLDIVYNPCRTALMLQAEELGLPTMSGLYMLVAQAKRASELFTGKDIDLSVIETVTKELGLGMQNIILIGMPGCGKTMVSAALSEKLGREVIDADQYLVEKGGMPIPEIFAQFGEEEFRKRETETLEEICKLSGKIISTGGGCVTRDRNYPLLHQNGTIIRLLRDTSKLDKEGRPLSQSNDLSEMFQKRDPMYRRFADITVDNNGTIEETIEQILKSI